MPKMEYTDFLKETNNPVLEFSNKLAGILKFKKRLREKGFSNEKLD